MSKDSISKTKEKSKQITSKDGSICVSTKNKTNLSDEPKSTRKGTKKTKNKGGRPSKFISDIITVNKEENSFVPLDVSTEKTEAPTPDYEYLLEPDEDEDLKPVNTKLKTDVEKKAEKDRVARVRERRRKIYMARDERVKEISEEYHYVAIGGKMRVLRIVYCPTAGHVLCFFSLPEFVNLFRHEPTIALEITDKGKIEYGSVATSWLASTLVTTYIKSVFEPQFDPLCTVVYKEKEEDRCINVWRGFSASKVAFDPNNKGLSFYLNHIKNIICNGSEECYTYVINFLAHMVQRPHEKPRSALIIKGGMGTGKGLFVEPLLAMIRNHSAITEKADDVVGRFNGVLECCVLLVFNEAFAGQKEASDTMKAVSESKVMRVERKGQEVIFMRSCLRCILLSNHDYILNIEKDDRRYIYLQTSDEKKLDFDYFSQLSDYINDKSFLNVLFSYLHSVDISNFLPDKVPKTETLREQQVNCLDLYDSFIWDMLSDDYNSTLKKWGRYTKNSELQDMLIKFNETKKLTVYGCPKNQLAKALKKIGVTGGVAKVEGGSHRVKMFPSINICRELFSKNILKWDFSQYDVDITDEVLTSSLH